MTLDIKTAEQKDFEELIEAIARELAEVPAEDRGKVYELAIDPANKQKIKSLCR